MDWRFFKNYKAGRILLAVLVFKGVESLIAFGGSKSPAPDPEAQVSARLGEVPSPERTLPEKVPDMSGKVGKLRTWKRADGTLLTEAFLLHQDQHCVSLLQSNGKIISVSLEMLSAEDRQFLLDCLRWLWQ